jgi:hypothetical protein
MSSFLARADITSRYQNAAIVTPRLRALLYEQPRTIYYKRPTDPYLLYSLDPIARDTQEAGRADKMTWIVEKVGLFACHVAHILKAQPQRYAGERAEMPCQHC